MIKKISIILLAVCVSACATVSSNSNTVRVCDSKGCSDRPTSESNIDYADGLSDKEYASLIAFEQKAKEEPTAAYDLALRFFRGDGVRQDSYLSLKWMRNAAERGELEAQKALGRLYLTGLNEMGADPGEAEKWLSITVTRGDTEAEELLELARSARQANQADYQWRKKWQPIFYNYWHTRYHYYWRWSPSGWVYLR